MTSTRRLDAEAADAADNQRRAEQKGWPVRTLDGEIIVKSAYFEGSPGGERRVLVTEDGKEYAWDRTQRGWAFRGVNSGGDAVDPEPEAEEPADEPEKAADPLAEQVSELTTEEPAPEPEPEPDPED